MRDSGRESHLVMDFSHPFPRFTRQLREADRYTFWHTARLALRADATVVVAVVNLQRATCRPSAEDVLVDAALADLPDTTQLVVPDFVAGPPLCSTPR